MTPRLIKILITNWKWILCILSDNPILQRKKAADTVVGNSYNMEKSNYYKKEAEPRTNKATFMDFDSGLAIAYKSATPPSAKPLL